MLDAWRGSPTRLREDGATEADLVRAGYRDRLLTELAQNAADAAAKASVPGRLAVWFDGPDLHVANTGVPLDVSGVHALTALRASAKSGADAAVGQFGVGFTAVLAVGDEIEFRSAAGSVRFSRSQTWEELRRNDIAVPDEPGFTAPALRLVWAIDTAPVAGFDSEIVVRLRADVDATALAAALRAEATDLLLELPALRSIRVDEMETWSESRDLGNGLEELRLCGTGIGDRIWWQFTASRARWLLPVSDGRPVPAGHDVLRAPTRSDEELSLPALLIADIPMQPDRRRMLPGSRVAELAAGYADFARALPPRDRLVLVPPPGFARSETDTLLREALIAELRTESWLPVVVVDRAGVPAPGTAAVARDAESARDALAYPADTVPDLLGAPSDRVVGPAATGGAVNAGAIPSAGFDADSSSDSLGAQSDRHASPAEAVRADSPAVRPDAAAYSAPAASDLPGAQSSLPGAQSGRVGGSSESPGNEADHSDAVRDSDDILGPWGDSVADPLDARAHGSNGSRGPLGVEGVEDAAVSSSVEVAFPTVVRDIASPRQASVFPGVTAELAELLADLIGPLVIPELSGRAVPDPLAVLDVHRIGLARIAELSSSLERPLQWWYSLYDALEPFVVDPLAAEELGALAVPLADGRLVTGPRTVVLGDELELAEWETGEALPVHWARLVHPEAAHSLLTRLGARQATVEDLLSDPALEAMLEDDPADPDTVDAVLRLAGKLPESAVLPTWLGSLELSDETGEPAPADELLLPGAPLAEVLVPESPFGTLAAAVVDRYGEGAVRAVGVGWGFSVVAESDPTGPDHDLDDEEAWWDTLAEDPPELIAVRDLDLVDDDAWPRALRLLLSEPRIRRQLADRDGYTAWWLRRHARLGGTPLGLFRAPGDPAFAGLLPEPDGIPAADLDALRAVLADPETITLDLAEALLAALGDPARTPSPDTIAQAHRRLAAALDRLDLDELVLPERVRALSGAVIEPADALILDEPCYGLAVPPARLVVGDPATARALGTLLDLPLVSEAVTAEVIGAGRASTWSAEPLGVLLRLQFGLPAFDGELVLHERLQVHLRGAYEATVEVPWWRDGATTHVQAQPISRTS
ncbi:sacsin N-terminal ATP-binding-like domain-containing protein [Nocardia albiluteola]|uniref:sacsin N-terminal ATP-binding-like domain-containing protein n=1 Tax=Nocardia albiluteola TaxID=2842303 RepID=UPI0027E1EDEA|nr:hypothetical protein [Nocardia albiluteola]